MNDRSRMRHAGQNGVSDLDRDRRGERQNESPPREEAVTTEDRGLRGTMCIEIQSAFSSIFLELISVVLVSFQKFLILSWKIEIGYRVYALTQSKIIENIKT